MTDDNIPVNKFGIPVDKNGNAIPLDAPLGYLRYVRTPWDAVEECRVVEMIGLDGSTEYYASVNKPKYNYNVRWSVFKTTRKNMVDKSLYV